MSTIITQKTDMPYEKFQRIGANSLTDAELLAIILRTGTKNKNAVEVATELLSHGKCGHLGLIGLHYLSVKQLQQIQGIGEVKAIKLKCISELALRLSRQVDKEQVNFKNPQQIADYYMEYLCHRSTECVLLLMLDIKGNLIQEKIISEGTVNKSLLSPRELFIEGLKNEAVTLVLLHNHPSGDCTPSRADVSITEQIVEVGKKLDLPLLDHIIIGDHKYISLKEKGYI